MRPIGLLNRPRRPLSRGFGPSGYPSKPLVSYQGLPTIPWVRTEKSRLADLLSDPDRAEAEIQAVATSLKSLRTELVKLQDISVLDVTVASRGARMHRRYRKHPGLLSSILFTAQLEKLEQPTDRVVLRLTIEGGPDSGVVVWEPICGATSDLFGRLSF